MTTSNFGSNSLIEASPPNLYSQDLCDKDDIAVLLDSIPQLDSNFHILRIIGRGTFSSVYLGCYKHGVSLSGRRHFAIKKIIPTSHPSRIHMELKCLKLMGGNDNIIEASLCLRNAHHIILVMPYFAHDDFVDYVGTLTTEEICDYLLNLFLALRRIHDFNIIHRDIKPGNFLYHRKYRKYALIDFGLAQEVGKATPPLSQKTESSAFTGGGQSKKTSFAETPRLPFCPQVKRKLSTSDYDFARGLHSTLKKLCVSSPFTSSSSLVRRSPRKFLSPKKDSSAKENSPLKTKGKDSQTDASLTDSPSKHTRLAAAHREGKPSSGHGDSGDMKSKADNFPDLHTPVRRSPRKPLNPLPWKSFTRGVPGSFSSSLLKNELVDFATRKTVKDSPSFAASLSSHSLNGVRCPASRGSSRRSSLLEEVRTKSGQANLRSLSCSCYGHAKVCTICMGRRSQYAPRAGTPGFRAPEVLMRHPDQTTAVDMWSAGVILLSLASGHYPFFRSLDDLASLSEITTLLGTKVVKKACCKLGKLFTSSETVPSLDVKLICQKLRKNMKRGKVKAVEENQSKCKGCKQLAIDCVCLKTLSKITPCSLNSYNEIESSTNGNGTSGEDDYPTSLYDLLYKLLDPNPYTRISAEEAIFHPFIVQYSKNTERIL